MNFLAHFSFEEESDRNGYFTMIVSADKPDEAVNKFKAEILRLKKDLFNGVNKIFIDDIIRINKIPEQATVIRFQSRSKNSLGIISINPVDNKNLQAFNWCPDGKEEEYEKDEHEVDPFIVFT